MSSFVGHALPGAMFFLLGAWWTVQVMRRYFMCRQTGERFRSTVIFPFFFCPGERMRKLPMEAIVMIALGGVGIIKELIGGINHTTHRFDSMHNGQHITMYSFFLLSGVLDILTSRGLAPEGSDYFGLVIALLMEGMLFKFHLFGRDKLDILIHTLLLHVIALSAVVVVLEHFNRQMAILPLMRALLTLVQGTWFWAVGFILYNPVKDATPWDPEDHHSLMLVVVLFGWHVAVNMLLMFIVGGVTACYYRGSCAVRYSSFGDVPSNFVGHEVMPFDPEVGNGKVKVYRDAVDLRRGKEDDDNSDLEFQAPVGY
nr:hypothetical protein BaRGS_013774 [Batillaria attramentaria]